MLQGVSEGGLLSCCCCCCRCYASASSNCSLPSLPSAPSICLASRLESGEGVGIRTLFHISPPVYSRRKAALESHRQAPSRTNSVLKWHSVRQLRGNISGV